MVTSCCCLLVSEPSVSESGAPIRNVPALIRATSSFTSPPRSSVNVSVGMGAAASCVGRLATGSWLTLICTASGGVGTAASHALLQDFRLMSQQLIFTCGVKAELEGDCLLPAWKVACFPDFTEAANPQGF